MPWSKRNLKSLFRTGILINEYPGWLLDGRKLLYFHGQFPPKEESRAPEYERLEEILQKTAEDSDLPLFKILYMDIHGHTVLVTDQTPPPDLLIPWNPRSIRLEALEHLVLYREYKATGMDGIHRVTYTEKKDVYTAIEKFLGSFLRGWSGLFSHRDVEDKKSLFENFSPIRTLGFLGDGALNDPTLTMYLNREDFTTANHFFPIRIHAQTINWQTIETIP